MNRTLLYILLSVVVLAGCIPAREFKSVQTDPRAVINWSAPDLTDISMHEVFVDASFSIEAGQCSFKSLVWGKILDPERKSASYFVKADQRLYVTVEYVALPYFLVPGPRRNASAYFSFVPEAGQEYEFTLSQVNDGIVLDTKSARGNMVLQSWSICQSPHDQNNYNIGSRVVGTPVRTY